MDHLSRNLVNIPYVCALIPFTCPHPMGTLAFDHLKVTNEVNVSELVMIRMCLAERLALNPDDYEAEQQLQKVELKVECALVGEM